MTCRKIVAARGGKSECAKDARAREIDGNITVLE